MSIYFLKLSILVFCFVGFFFRKSITATTWHFCFPYVCLQKIVIHRKCVADTWLQGAVNDSIYMVIMHQASLRDTLCTPQLLQKVNPKWQGFWTFVFIKFIWEQPPAYSSAHSIWKAKSTTDITPLKLAQQETGNFMTLPLKAVKGRTCIFYLLAHFHTAKLCWLSFGIHHDIKHGAYWLRDSEICWSAGFLQLYFKCNPGSVNKKRKRRFSCFLTYWS